MLDFKDPFRFFNLILEVFGDQPKAYTYNI